MALTGTSFTGLSNKYPKLFALGAAFMVFLVLFAIDHNERELAIQKQKIEVIGKLEVLRTRLGTGLTSTISAARVVAVNFAIKPELSLQEFNALAAEVASANPTIHNLVLVKGTVPRYVYPYQGNQQILGVDYRNLPKQWPVYQRMMEEHSIQIAGPLNLVQGGVGLVVRIPVYQRGMRDEFLGSIAIVLDYNALLQETNVRKWEKDMLLAIRGRDGKGSNGEVFFGDGSLFSSNAVTQTIILPGGAWELGALPKDGWRGATRLSTMIEVLGAMLCLMAWLLSYQAIVRRRQRELDSQELQIAAMAFETEEGILITDANLVILRVNRAFTRITGYEASEAIGQNTRLLQSGRHDEIFYQQMWDEIHRTSRWQGELWNRRKNGEIYSERLVISAVRGADGKVTNYVGSFNDVTEHKVSEEKIHQLAFFDPLTGLPNRRLLLDRLGRALSLSHRHQRYGAVVMIDIDNFKTLNDTQGHNMGDMLLIQIGKRIHECVRADDTVSRTGGDEFVIVLEGLHEQSQHAATLAEHVAEKIRHILSLTFNLGHLNYDCSGSIGITLFGVEQVDIDELLRRADMAMYQAKAAGKNNVRFFDPSMQAALEIRTALENDLRHALAQQELILHYQLQVSALGDPVGAEVLLRWKHPARGLVSPLDFIPLAEETGLILPIGLWVLATACQQIAMWADDPVKGGMQLAVNVSARQFRHPDFVDDVTRILRESGANPVLLKLELTESVILEDVAAVIDKMTAIKKLGVGFSMDDFGTGYSSLSYLQRLPLTQLKIDRSFIHNLPNDSSNASIVRTIINLGGSLDLNVIAEGVETEQQRDFLLHAGCQAYQGYLFCKPLPIEEFELLIDQCYGWQKADSPEFENQVS